VSYQSEWQQRQVEAGLCQICAKPRKHYSQRCDKCAVKHRLLARKKLGLKGRAVSGIGRKCKAFQKI